MGQVLRAMSYNRPEDTVAALSLSGTPLTWNHLDDGVMGGKSITNLSVSESKSLQFNGTIDTEASVGWASARASIKQGLLPPKTESISVTAQGDGKTYKLILMDDNHDKRWNKSPLWESNLPTKANVVETTPLPLKDFTPSFMAQQLSDDEKKKHALDPSKVTKIGFMLSSKLSDGTPNPKETYGEGSFSFSLRVDAVDVVKGDQQ